MNWNEETFDQLYSNRYGAALLTVLLVISNRQTPAWKSSLDQYLTYLRSAGEPSYLIVTSVQAAQPSNFTPSMTAESFSNREIYTTPYTSGQYLSSLMPIPYPPDQGWCVLLQDGGQQRLVYVALHSSDYNADWIIHIPSDPWGSPALQSSLSSIGCTLEQLYIHFI